ncbi:hypothetical protein EYM_02655 [Ignicoccus islandicus DSM 13165]|uniref:Uncharacterized protein n=1 Tax=Ignicoccus islandicus DSM 13165 TaxID=940295 RepID=A0A0U3F8K1_9CREN|nr:hypothetical protein EYM_02655 [Ignicoccus islandicus DSM 13165]
MVLVTLIGGLIGVALAAFYSFSGKGEDEND